MVPVVGTPQHNIKMFNSMALFDTATKFERKMRVETAINYVLPLIIKVNPVEEMIRRMERGDPPSIPIFIYRTTQLKDNVSRSDMVDGKTVGCFCDEQESKLNGISMSSILVEEVLDVLQALLGNHIHIWHDITLILNTTSLQVLETALVATYSTTKNPPIQSWINETWDLSKVTVNEKVVWNQVEVTPNNEDYLNKVRLIHQLPPTVGLTAKNVKAFYVQLAEAKKAVEAALALEKQQQDDQDDQDDQDKEDEVDFLVAQEKARKLKQAKRTWYMTRPEHLKHCSDAKCTFCLEQRGKTADQGWAIIEERLKFQPVDVYEAETAACLIEKDEEDEDDYLNGDAFYRNDD